MHMLAELNVCGSRTCVRGLVSEGWLSERQLDDLSIFNYTKKTEFEPFWTNVTRQCRGLILRLDGDKVVEVVALPFPKFFNHNEPLGRDTPLPDGHPEVTAKLDGSFAILYRHHNKICWASRGSFDSEHAKAANEIWGEYYTNVRVPNELTLMAELLHPVSSNIVKYDLTGLILIGCRNRFTGYDFSYNELAVLAKELGMPLVQQYESGTPEQLLASVPKHGHVIRAHGCGTECVRPAHMSAGLEGWVLRWPNGFRLKVKTEDYLRCHRLTMNLTPKRIAEAWVQNISPKKLAGCLPNHVASVVAINYEQLDNAYASVTSEFWELAISASVHSTQPTGTSVGQQFALWVQAKAPRDMWASLFAWREGRLAESTVLLKKLASMRVLGTSSMSSRSAHVHVYGGGTEKGGAGGN